MNDQPAAPAVPRGAGPPPGFIPISRRSDAQHTLQAFVARSPPPPYSSAVSPPFETGQRGLTADSDSRRASRDSATSDVSTVIPEPDGFVAEESGGSQIDTRHFLDSSFEAPAPSDPDLRVPFDVEPPNDTDLPAYTPNAYPGHADITHILRPVENLEAFMARLAVSGPGARPTASRSLATRPQGARIPVSEIPFGSLTRPTIVAVPPPAVPLQAGEEGTRMSDAGSCITAVEPATLRASQESMRRFPPEYCMLLPR